MDPSSQISRFQQTIEIPALGFKNLLKKIKKKKKKKKKSQATDRETEIITEALDEYVRVPAPK